MWHRNTNDTGGVNNHPGGNLEQDKNHISDPNPKMDCYRILSRRAGHDTVLIWAWCDQWRGGWSCRSADPPARSPFIMTFVFVILSDSISTEKKYFQRENYQKTKLAAIYRMFCGDRLQSTDSVSTLFGFHVNIRSPRLSDINQKHRNFALMYRLPLRWHIKQHL